MSDHKGTSRTTPFIYGLALVAALALTGCASSGKKAVDPRLDAVSPHTDIEKDIEASPCAIVPHYMQKDGQFVPAEGKEDCYMVDGFVPPPLPSQDGSNSGDNFIKLDQPIPEDKLEAYIAGQNTVPETTEEIVAKPDDKNVATAVTGLLVDEKEERAIVIKEDGIRILSSEETAIILHKDYDKFQDIYKKLLGFTTPPTLIEPKRDAKNVIILPNNNPTP